MHCMAMNALTPHTAVCDNAPTTDVSLTTGMTCAAGTGVCDTTGQDNGKTVSYGCSAGYTGTPQTITCNGGVTNAWVGTAPTCSGMGLEEGSFAGVH